MISEELKQNIIPNLKMTILEEEWERIDTFFEEVYVIHENGQNIICLHPGTSGGEGSTGISLMFTELTGAYYDMGQWSYIKKVGRRL